MKHKDCIRKYGVDVRPTCVQRRVMKDSVGGPPPHGPACDHQARNYQQISPGLRHDARCRGEVGVIRREVGDLVEIGQGTERDVARPQVPGVVDFVETGSGEQRAGDNCGDRIAGNRDRAARQINSTATASDIDDAPGAIRRYQNDLVETNAVDAICNKPGIGGACSGVDTPHIQTGLGAPRLTIERRRQAIQIT